MLQTHRGRETRTPCLFISLHISSFLRAGGWADGGGGGGGEGGYKLLHYLACEISLVIIKGICIEHSHERGRSLVRVSPLVEWDVWGCRSTAASALSFHSANINF